MTDLWKHQQQALEFIRARNHTLLAMDMGTGKTCVVVVVVKEMEKQTRQSMIIIVCPKSVLPVWSQEFTKFYPGNVGVRGVPDEDVTMLTCFKGNSKKKAGEIVAMIKRLESQTLRPGHRLVIVVNYKTAITAVFKRLLHSIKWDMAVLDECHRIKSASGVTSKIMARLRAVSKLGLTGTPMPHSPLDIFAQARFLSMEWFGISYVRFRARFAIMGGYSVNGRPVQVLGFQNMDKFEKICSNFMFQVKADDVLDLPEHHHIKRTVILEPKARRIYDEIQEDFVSYLESGVGVSATNTLDRLNKLHQITGGNVRQEDDEGNVSLHEISTAKREVLTDILIDLPHDEPIVVFAIYKADLDSIAYAAEKSGRECLSLRGGLNELTEWQRRKEGEILAVQIQAGGVGVSMVRARYCICYSVGFSLGDYEQLKARIHRPGQTRSVTYFHLLAENTVDPKIYAALDKRRNVVTEILLNVATAEAEKR